MAPEELERGLQAWREAVLNDPSARWDSPRDLSYWARVAERYEAARAPLPRTLRALRAYLRPDWTLLDAGAGTGRFTRPLADAVRHVTALDYSSAMLEVLGRNCPPNVTCHLGHFQDATVPPHDVVLCAWALYRSLDLRADVQALWRRTRQRLLILEDNGTAAPHVAWRRGPSRLPFARTDLIAGVLRACTPNVEVVQVQEERAQAFADPADLLAFARVPAEQREAFLSALSPYLTWTPQGLQYTYTSTVTLVTAQRTEPPA
ncbi:class I SAM-dependent methyltransferase [Deinococcus maricopensis]|uniref:Methyltransferase type 11 n=1 Tax=Deinococcus maricopensis (strain DSM 21211 / LMG 22137 / NRRL B-23946 / LB-34) TaxID=709986 RepID=E8U331_DEIML|nr:methyltransferase domain-containing protein [Deinococcus maricopensis]ADV65769.1 Methyltransferase type 11 [Deinococcus maricopensis DSM 21211]